jgi:predicted O-methyltransferase YrrM
MNPEARQFEVLPRLQAVTHPIPKLRRSFEKRLCSRWLWGKELSNRWGLLNIPVWRRVLVNWRNIPVRILEVGSWEGGSAIIFLKYLRRSSIVCIDTFEGGIDQLNHPRLAKEIAMIEGRFDRNLASFVGRVEKIKSDSIAALDALAAAGRCFDLAYIDGSHLRDDVMADSIRVWPLIVPGGCIIWDDYEWKPRFPPEQRPQPAIDAFLSDHTGNYRLLAKAKQMIVERLR